MGVMFTNLAFTKYGATHLVQAPYTEQVPRVRSPVEVFLGSVSDVMGRRPLVRAVGLATTMPLLAVLLYLTTGAGAASSSGPERMRGNDRNVPYTQSFL